MKVATSSGSRGIGGLAKIEIHPSQPKVKVTLKPAEEGKKPEVVILNKENCPQTVRNGTFLVDLNKEKTKMFGIRPYMGVFKLRVLEFIAPKDKEPAPKTKTGKGDRGEFSYQTFSVSFEILEGECKGMIVLGNYSYNFEEDEEKPGYTRISHSGSSYTKKLIEFLQVTGVMKYDVPWKENLLPSLQRVILKDGLTFSGSVKNGWADSLFADGTF